MTDKPIIFSGPMVRALLDGRKTQTRRVLKPQPYQLPNYPGRWNASGQIGGVICVSDRDLLDLHRKPRLGDRLYVREAFSYETLDVDRNGFMPPWYWADGTPTSGDYTRPRPSIHMPRWASRLTLTVTDVRVQRLQDISEADAVSEGIERLEGSKGPNHFTREITGKWGGSFNAPTAQEVFADLWSSLHGPDAWDENPWVVALTFTVARGNIDAITGATP